MKYELEFYTTSGESFGPDHLSQFKSNSPMLVPAKGDEINIEGADDAYFVVKRIIAIYEEDGETIYSIQVYCGTEDEVK